MAGSTASTHQEGNRSKGQHCLLIALKQWLHDQVMLLCEMLYGTCNKQGTECFMVHLRVTLSYPDHLTASHIVCSL
jgi:hypothetical protein